MPQYEKRAEKMWNIEYPLSFQLFNYMIDHTVGKVEYSSPVQMFQAKLFPFGYSRDVWLEVNSTVLSFALCLKLAALNRLFCFLNHKY